MSDQEETTSAAVQTTEPNTAEVNEEPTADQVDAESESAKATESATTPEFQELEPTKPAVSGAFELSRFSGVQVMLSAELGRAQVTLEELMGLGEGTVLELDREIGAPVELIAQGVSVGNGEVVVIEDRFAIRIKQIYQNN